MARPRKEDTKDKKTDTPEPVPETEAPGNPTPEPEPESTPEPEPTPEPEEKTYTEAEVQEMLRAAAEKNAATAKSAEKAPTVNMVVEQKAPPVKILYIDSAIPNNQIPIGNNRYITGSGRIFAVPLEQFEGEFMTPLVMKLLDNRKFVVLSGLTDEQRQQYNCWYGAGEVIKSEGVFDSLLTLPVRKASEIFAALCDAHRQLVATRFMTAYFEKHDNRVSRERVEALNAVSRKNGGEGLFTPIVKDINKANE